MILKGDLSHPFETIAMPKKRFGPRPVTISSTASRVAYLALVDSMAEDLGPQSRADGNWEEFKAFALKSEGRYVVKFDIASFYEYVDHELLKQRVLEHTLKPESVTVLQNVLESVTDGKRGLPQLFPASDHLADVYIGQMERRLIRDGFKVARYVDDFTVPCDDWETANTVVERGAEYARNLGLVLSSEKTSITKRETLILAEQSEAQFINEYFQAVKDELSQVFMWGPYGDLDSETITPDDNEAMMATMWSLLYEWKAKLESVEPEDAFHEEGHFRAYLSSALGWVRGNTARVSDDVLHEIVFKHPLFLVGVCGYVSFRATTFPFKENPWASIKKLVFMGRQSAWAKLWLLDTVSQLHSWKWPSADYAAVMTWVNLQLRDRHEIVRAQAAWAAACHGQFTEDRLVSLYTQATPISQPALAACMGRQGGIGSATVKSITDDGPMLRKAHEWAQEKEASKD
jgi:hypothetical protein